jgi:hypothetical protein
MICRQGPGPRCCTVIGCQHRRLRSCKTIRHQCQEPRCCTTNRRQVGRPTVVRRPSPIVGRLEACYGDRAGAFFAPAVEAIASAIAKEAAAAAKEAEDHVEPPMAPKGFKLKSCFFRSLMPYPRSFKSSPERDHRHRFSWGVRFCSLPSLSCLRLNQLKI